MAEIGGGVIQSGRTLISPTPFDDDDDAPSPGTPCCVCRSIGHFCQATAMTAGDSGNGICAACLEGRDCDVMRVRKGVLDPGDRLDKSYVDERSDADTIAAVFGSGAISSTRSLPKHYARTPVRAIEQALLDGKSSRAISRDLKVSPNTVLTVRKPIQDSLPPVPTGAAAHKQPLNRPFGAHAPIPEETRQAILAEPASVSNIALEKKYKVPVSWIGKFRRENGIVTDGMRGRGRAHGQSYKQAERDKAAAMLQQGATVDAAASESKLSLGTIRNICRELGIDYASRREGGLRQRRTEKSQAVSTEVRSTDVTLVVTASTTTVGPAPVTAPTIAEIDIPSATPPTVTPPTLSRAFEMVLREMHRWNEALADNGEDDPSFQEALAEHNKVIGFLRDYAPQFTGLGDDSNKSQGVYERALKVARQEEQLCRLELQRLQKRHVALKALLATMGLVADDLRDTE